MRMRSVIAIVWLCLPLGAIAQVVPVGKEFQVNSYTPLGQAEAHVAAAADGSFVVVWRSGNRDGQESGVFGQRYDSAGQATGTEFQVNSYTLGSQKYPVVAAGADGTFVVAWVSYGDQDGDGSGLFAQRYDNAGLVVGTEFQITSYTISYQRLPAVAVGDDGTFVLAWESQYQSGTIDGAFAQRYDSAGDRAGAEFQISIYTLDGQGRPRVTYGADRTFVVVWHGVNFLDDDLLNVFGKRFDSAGQAVGSEFRVNSYTLGFQIRPRVSSAADGTFVVVWTSYYQGYDSSFNVFAQRYDSAGQASGSEFQVNSYTPHYQVYPEVAVASDGSFMVVWTSRSQDGGGSNYDGVFGQRYDSAGRKAGAEFQVNTYTLGSQTYPAVAAGAEGSFVVIWQSFQDGSLGGVFGQRFAEVTATPTSTPTTADTLSPSPTPTLSSTPTSTPSVASCPATPVGTCATPVRAQLQLKLGSTEGKNKLKWKFGAGPLLAQANFGDPTTTASYALCIYDDGALAAELQIGPSGTLWKPIGSEGYKFKDTDGASDGVTKMKLLGGEPGRSKLQLKGRGANLPMPAPATGTRLFAQTSAVIAQLREVNGDCYATTFTDADTQKNDGTQYKARK